MTKCSAAVRLFLRASLLAASLAAASGCGGEDDDCAGASCERSEPRDDELAPTGGEPAPRQPAPLPCRSACEALTGACGEEAAAGDTTSIRAVAACIDWCEAGGLDADEADCLATGGCERSADCLAG